MRMSDGSSDVCSSDLAQEEIFGPVLSILPYEGEDSAVQIANDSPYGLSGGVWGADAERARKVAKQIRTGPIEVNGGAFQPAAPLGGPQQSGYGREHGVHSLVAFHETTSLQQYSKPRASSCSAHQGTPNPSRRKVTDGPGRRARE